MLVMILATVMISITLGELTYYMAMFGGIAYIISYSIIDLYEPPTKYEKISNKISLIFGAMAVAALMLLLSMFITGIIIYNGHFDRQLTI